MNIKFRLLLVFLVSLGLFVTSCKENTKDATKKSAPIIIGTPNVPTEFKSLLRPNKIIELGNVYRDTLQYIDFNDEGDDRRFIVKKNNDTISLIYNEELKNKYILGDQLAITWKIDSIRYAGDSDYLDFIPFLISAQKIKTVTLKDKKIKFLWRAVTYDEHLKMDINSLILNEDYIKTIAAPEKAALAYIATFIGNECAWDERMDENRSNLKCKIIWALGLEYQCSHKHLAYLQFWFRNNDAILKSLKRCPKKPNGATVQNTFDEIILEVKDTIISVSFKASGYNLRENESWNWTEKHDFQFNENELLVVHKEIAPRIKTTVEISEN